MDQHNTAKYVALSIFTSSQANIFALQRHTYDFGLREYDFASSARLVLFQIRSQFSCICAVTDKLINKKLIASADQLEHKIATMSYECSFFSFTKYKVAIFSQQLVMRTTLTVRFTTHVLYIGAIAHKQMAFEFVYTILFGLKTTILLCRQCIF